MARRRRYVVVSSHNPYTEEPVVYGGTSAEDVVSHFYNNIIKKGAEIDEILYNPTDMMIFTTTDANSFKDAIDCHKCKNL